MFFDPLYFLFLAPALLLGFYAQWRVRSAFSQASEVPTRLSGAEAALRVLESAGLERSVGIEQTEGYLSDHYDPTEKVLRLSPDVYHGHTAAAVGVAAHEAGHAIQDAEAYSPLVIRNAVVPVASLGSNAGILLIIFGALLSSAAMALGPLMVWAGIGLYAVVVFFQLVNLPVEYDASARAKQQLAYLGLVNQQQADEVQNVLGAAALTYVAATLSAVLTLLYFLIRFAPSNQD